jgi:hypothetical protein
LSLVVALWTVVRGDASGDRRALLAIAAATGSAAWKHNLGWPRCSSSGPNCTVNGATLSHKPEAAPQLIHCLWYGVVCDPLNGRVKALLLGDNNLTGHIPPEIAWLTELEVLDLNGARPKSYSGCATTNFGNTSLPVGLFQLRKLRELWVEYSCLAGPLPLAFSNLTRLTVAKLHGNFFTGSIPSAAFNVMKDLSWFDVGRNPLSGPFPHLPNCTKLQKFSANFCALTGPIPRDALQNKPDLIHTFWDGNGFTGTLPSFDKVSQKLRGLSFDINALSGPIPESLCALPNNINCRVGADTDTTIYKANYPWLIPVRGNVYSCPLPACMLEGFCNKQCTVSGERSERRSPCSPVKCA